MSFLRTLAVGLLITYIFLNYAVNADDKEDNNSTLTVKDEGYEEGKNDTKNDEIHTIDEKDIKNYEKHTINGNDIKIEEKYIADKIDIDKDDIYNIIKKEIKIEEKYTTVKKDVIKNEDKYTTVENDIEHDDNKSEKSNIIKQQYKNRKSIANDKLDSLDASCNKGKDGFYQPSKMMVSLLVPVPGGYKHVCSGVLLNSNYVLTSGSCVKVGSERPNFVVEMWKMEKFLDEHQQEDMYYNGDTTSVLAWYLSQIEAAILKLDKPIEEGLFVHYAQLPGNDISNVFHNFCPSITSMGWGLKKNDTIVPSQYLQCVEVLKLSDNECREACKHYIEQGKYAYDKEITFCTVSSNMSQVDVGGPLICNGYMVFAMTIASEHPSLPQLNFRVDKELNFIYSALGIPSKRLGRMRSGCNLNIFYFKYLPLLIALVHIIIN